MARTRQPWNSGLHARRKIPIGCSCEHGARLWRQHPRDCRPAHPMPRLGVHVGRALQRDALQDLPRKDRTPKVNESSTTQGSSKISQRKYGREGAMAPHCHSRVECYRRVLTPVNLGIRVLWDVWEDEAHIIRILEDSAHRL